MVPEPFAQTGHGGLCIAIYGAMDAMDPIAAWFLCGRRGVHVLPKNNSRKNFGVEEMKLFRCILAGAFAGHTVDQHAETREEAEKKVYEIYAKRGYKIRIRKTKEIR